MTDPHLSTRPLPPGVVAAPVWGDILRADGTPAHRYLLHWSHPDRTGPRNLVIGMNPSGASAEDVARDLKCSPSTIRGDWRALKVK